MKTSHHLKPHMYYHNIMSSMCKDTVMPWEKHLVSKHLNQYAGSRPNIHCGQSRQAEFYEKNKKNKQQQFFAVLLYC